MSKKKIDSLDFCRDQESNLEHYGHNVICYLYTITANEGELKILSLRGNINSQSDPVDRSTVKHGEIQTDKLLQRHTA
uniref:Uncharacterized protein n=1 Tax=Bracon brevicornis TaxID=1563983 RepID=A0A6V7LC25_9HYME